MNWSAKGEELASNRNAISDLIRVVKSMPEVETVATSTNTPFSGASWGDGTRIDGKPVHFLYTLTSPELSDVLRLELIHGRWIDETDAALGYRPVVLSRNLARGVFGTDDPIGRDMPFFNDDGEQVEAEEGAEIRRVVGVTENYRRRGELENTPYVMFVAVDLAAGEQLPWELLVRVRPGVTAAFEEQLVRTMQAIAPQWSYSTALLESKRRNTLLNYITPVLISLAVVASLIIMVGLGLVGVLWLSVTRRTAELGLRRAMGASSTSVRRQILAELWALTAIAVVVGAVIFLQLPLFGASFGAGWPVFLGGVILATLVIYGVVTICGLYPTWLATRVQPAVALQHE
jgi:putative ABC transport system permease protein